MHPGGYECEVCGVRDLDVVKVDPAAKGPCPIATHPGACRAEYDREEAVCGALPLATHDGDTEELPRW